MKIELHKISVRDVAKGCKNNDEEGIANYGGKTSADNCQMLRKDCNRRKVGK
jgi:hypothetical protein